jgi:parvulin-like peptidyl-prolyl isomerase
MHRLKRVVLALFVFSSFAVSQQATRDSAVIGRVGDEFISEREFIERYELTPDLYRHRKTESDFNKAEFLYSMIAEKLLAQEALTRHYDRDTLYQNAINDLTQKLARDKLFKNEVRANVTVTPAEIISGMAQARKELLLRFIYFESKSDAEFIRKQVRTARDFDRLKIDSTYHAVVDTATVIWGDAEQAIQNAAYKLSLNQVSPVVAASQGFYILKLVRERPAGAYANLPPETLRDQVIKKVRERKEKAEALRYMGRTLKAKRAFSPPALFRKFSDTLLALLDRHRHEPQNTLTNEMTSELADRCRPFLNDSLVVTAARSWTVGEIISRLYIKSFPTTFTTLKQVGNGLYDEFQEWADQSLLEQEAMQKGLDRDPDVQDQLKPWRDRYLSEMMKEAVGKTVTATDADVYGFLKYSDSSTAVPMVKLRELHTRSLDDMRNAINDLNSGSTFADIVSRYSSSSLEQQRKGEGDFFPITGRKPVGEIAWQLEPGQKYGPVEDGGGYLLFEVVEKNDVLNPSATSATAKFARAKENYLRHKRARMVTLFIAQSASKRGYDIYADRLKKLEVTTIPMLTYRFLGFGGRMFAVPFVEKQLQWMQEEPPAEIIVP